MAKWYCKDCDEIYDEDILLDYWYENTSTHFIEEVKCKCGNEEIQEVIDWDMQPIVDLMDSAIKRLEKLV